MNFKPSIKNLTISVRFYAVFLRLSVFVLWPMGIFSADAQGDSLLAIAHGAQLFRRNCASCHSVHSEKTGPVLASITKKRPAEWLVRFIQNSRSVIQQDEYAKTLSENFGGQLMPSFQKLSPGEINDILKYIANESLKPTAEDFDDAKIFQQKNTDLLQGRKLFKDQCQTCHLIHAESFGPALGSVGKRHSVEWLLAFIRNSSKVIASGDPYAVHLYAQFDKKAMVTMEFLSPSEIKSILQYINYASTMKTHSASEH